MHVLAKAVPVCLLLLLLLLLLHNVPVLNASADKLAEAGNTLHNHGCLVQ